MMGYNDGYVKVTHVPTGLTAIGKMERSQIKNRNSAMERVKGMYWALRNAPRTRKLRRTYVIPDGERTIPDLETGDCVDRQTLQGVQLDRHKARNR